LTLRGLLLHIVAMEPLRPSNELSGARRNIVLLSTPTTSALEVAGPAEAFRMSVDKLAEAGRSNDLGYQVHLLSSVDVPYIETDGGIRFVPHSFYEHYTGPIDTLLIVGGLDVWTGRDTPELLDWVREQADRARRFGSVCTGAFVLAEAGLLAGQRVTTHWYFCERLAREYPDVTVDPEPIFIRTGRLSTTAGVTAGLDLALSMIEEDLGLEIALRVARALVVYVRRPGSQPQFSSALSLQAPRRLPFQDLPFWIMENLGQPLTVGILAERMAMSPRNFVRQFVTEFGITPHRFVTQARLELARRLLSDTARSREEVAVKSGFGSVDALERALRKR
jgi:transcriptional regulator GlxA family with amidase domain